MEIDVVRERLRHHRPTTVDGTQYARAAVAVVLRPGPDGAEFVAIRRAERPNDPWSGHMALPGGRQSSSDADLFATAARETFEEVGIDLRRDGELLGHLDDLQAIGRGRLLDLVIRPVVCAVTGPVTLHPDPTEVHTALWVPLASLRRAEVQGRHRSELGGQALDHPAFVYQGHTIWGLTYRILSGLLAVLP